MNNFDIRRIDLNLLVVFEVLMKERHVGRAADRLNLSQSAVSHALGRLREQVGDPLFVRHPRGIEPTPRGLVLWEGVSDVLERARTVLAPEQPFSPRRARRFTIGQTDGAAAILVRLIEQLRSDAPNVELYVRRMGAAEVIPAIDRQDVDAAFAVMPPARMPPRIAQLPAHKLNYVCIARNNHPAVRRPPKTPEKFAALNHLAISPYGAPTSRVDQLLADVGIRRNTVLTIPHFLAAPLIVAKTDLVAVIDESTYSLFSGYGNLRTIKMPAALESITIDLLMSSARMQEPAMAWLRGQCLAAAQS
ncbi:MAG: LysR family transcriptional regulator [Burkholderiaceae bacterium]|nr:MAG: LysR family transcriptional regulator [Burkholderiaceae bacterium]TAM10944.1 MAG: LysR family transcriptional regulator [Pusillimonas sp.]